MSDFHRLRIRCKRLRYALEFSADVYGGRTSPLTCASSPRSRTSSALMQDAEVASLRLADLATGETRLPAATVFVMGGVAERHRREVDRLLSRLPKRAAAHPRTAWRELPRPHGAPPGRGRGGTAARPHARSAPPRPAREADAGAAHRSAPEPAPGRHPAAVPGLTALAPPPRSGQGE